MSTVIGIDGCRAGWITTKILDNQLLSFQIIENLNQSSLKNLFVVNDLEELSRHSDFISS